jgi:hypothetical protein
VNGIHRNENTESETPNELHPLDLKRVNSTTQKGESVAPHTSYTRQNNSITTTNGDVGHANAAERASSSLVKDLQLGLGLSKSQCETVAGFVLSHGEDYVRAKARIAQSKSFRNRGGALRVALVDDWQPSLVPAEGDGSTKSPKGLASAEGEGREKRWTW